MYNWDWFLTLSTALALFSIIMKYYLLLFSQWAMSDSLRSDGLQPARLPSPSPSPGVCSNLFPLSWWCHPTISTSVVPFSSCLQSFLVSQSSPVSWFFKSGGQSIGASASVLSVSIQGWFPLRLTGLISLLSKELSGVVSSTTSWKASILWRSAFFIIQLSQPYVTTGKTIALTIWMFVGE